MKYHDMLLRLRYRQRLTWCPRFIMTLRSQMRANLRKWIDSKSIMPWVD